MYVTDGTAAGTRALSAVAPTAPPANARTFFAGPDGALYYFAAGGLWRTDGTPGGTGPFRGEVDPQFGIAMAPVLPSSVQAPEWALVAGGRRLVFQSSAPAVGAELWAYDLGAWADCNGNGIADAVDLAQGRSAEVDGDGVPDECGCPADWDRSGGLDVLDVTSFLTDWFAGRADYDRSGGTDLRDIFAFLRGWFAGCV